MSPLTVTSVASAAIISGDLIIGLSDGSIINCGRVQGPQGLDGPAGPIGAPGRPGQDGNTILTSEGLPRADVGTNGDYIIDKVSWTIYGPKASGVWGIGTPLRGNGKGGSAQKRDLADGVPTSGDGSSGGGGKVYTTSNLPLSGTGRSSRITAPGGNIIPEGSGLKYQSNLNKWIENSLRALDTKLPVAIVDTLPDTGQYEGDLVLFEGALYVWAGDEWTRVSGDGGGVVISTIPPVPGQQGQLWFNNSEDELTLYIYDGANWVPAAPPVSLDGINTAIANVDAELMKVNANIAMNKRDIDEAVLDVREDQTRQDGGIETNARDITQLRSRVGDLEHGQGGGEFLPTAGGELKGTLEINGSRDKDGKINPLLCRADGYYMSFGVNKDGEVFAGSSEGQPFLASSSWHVVTKGYLDSQASRHFGSPY